MPVPDCSMFDARDVADIALQRTQTLLTIPCIGPIAFRAWNKGFESLLLWEARVRRSRILADAWDEVVAEWDTIGPHVPKRGAGADIGSGHGLLSLAAARAQEFSKLYLVDIERTASKHHSFSERGAGYASLAKASEFLRSNGYSNVATCNPLNQELPMGPLDCIFSVISAGFHYPIEEYANYARRTLNAGGLLIFDMRHDTDQMKFLHGFDCTEIHVGSKFSRMLARKSG